MAVMPSSGLCRVRFRAVVEHLDNSGVRARHAFYALGIIRRTCYRFLRKASSLSSGRKRRTAFPSAKGVVLESAISLSRRSASRYICVVSIDSCPSQSAITERSTPACSSFITAVCRSTCGVTRLLFSEGHDCCAVATCLASRNCTPSALSLAAFGNYIWPTSVV